MVVVEVLGSSRKVYGVSSGQGNKTQVRTEDPAVSIAGIFRFSNVLETLSIFLKSLGQPNQPILVSDREVAHLYDCA